MGRGARDDSREEVVMMKNAGAAVARRAADLGGPWSLGEGRLADFPRADLVSARSDPALMASAATTRFYAAVYLLELTALEQLATQIAERIERAPR